MQEEASIAGENYVVKKAWLLFLTNSNLPCHDVCSSVVVSEVSTVNTVRFVSLLCLPGEHWQWVRIWKVLGQREDDTTRIRWRWSWVPFRGRSANTEKRDHYRKKTAARCETQSLFWFIRVKLLMLSNRTYGTRSDTPLATRTAHYFLSHGCNRSKASHHWRPSLYCLPIIYYLCHHSYWSSCKKLFLTVRG